MSHSFHKLPPSAALRRFKPIEFLSQNDIAQSWVAENLNSGQTSFLKILNTESNLENGMQKEALLNSYGLQRRIRSADVIVAVNKHGSKDMVVIEYPYYPAAEWAPLSEERFWRDVPDSLIQMTLIIDYLHLIDLVHGDIKLGNFLIHTKSGKIRLSDLEFLKEPGTPLKALIVGSPEHIAPEIFQDLPATTVSDNFAFGMLLRQCLKRGNKHENAEQVGRLSELLTIEESYQRPEIILDALRDIGIIDDGSFDRLNRRLFHQQVVSIFGRYRKDIFADSAKAQEFFPVRNRTVGVPRELIEELFTLSQESKMAAFKAGRELISDSPLVRRSDYWQIMLDNPALTAFYRNYFSNDVGTIMRRIEVDPVNSLNQAMAVAEEYEKGGKIIKALTLLQFARSLSSGHEPAVEDSRNLLLRLCRLSEKCKRTEDVVAYGQEALNLYDGPSDDYYSLALTIITHTLITGDVDRVRQLIDGLLATCEESNPFYPEFMRFRAWVHGIRAEYDQAFEILTNLISKHEPSGPPSLLVKLYNNLGVMYWRKGDLNSAEDNYQKAISIGRRDNIIAELISPEANLSNSYYESANYTEALKLCKEALKLADHLNDNSKSYSTNLVMAACYSRLDDYAKAKYYINEHRADSSNNLTHIGLCFTTEGMINLNAGILSDAAQLIFKGLSLVDYDGFTRSHGKFSFLMSQIMFYTGAIDNALMHSGKAIEIFQHLNDKAAADEAKMVEAVIRLYHFDEGDCVALGNKITEAYRQRNIYYAFWGLFLATLKLGEDIYRYVDDDMVKLIETFADSQVAVFKATFLLHRLLLQELPPTQLINDLKEIYRIMDSAGKYYMACKVCERISEYYAENRQLRLAVKYLDQGIKIAERLSNRFLIDDLTSRRDALSDNNLIWEERIDILYKISEVLTDVTDYGNALMKILAFAVNEAGAERGALLLRSGDSDSLQVKAYINCDNQSLTDISQLSRSIPELAALHGNPLIIGNALQDDRTMHFKSVVLHNIQSVLCVPISYNKNILGVLYLDHYTIPALFSKSDISFVIALTNFIGLLITLAQKYNVIQITNDQLLSDLKTAGANQPFITKDRSLLNRFTQLPDIACTNASVLITGESGTGKEILCHMLHAMSQRADKPLIKLNCASIPPTLFEAELFGIEKGVATGVNRRIGKFAAADTGTLFLDEVGDMPLSMQAKVLRAIEYQKFEMVGSHRTITTDIRFIYATNKDLPSLIGQGTFREDLYYRINTITIELPPLRERRDDIFTLINHFAGVFMPKGKSINISQEALKAFLEYPWPGNVRELKNVIERLCILRGAQPIRVSDLPREFTETPKMIVDTDEMAERIERDSIIKMLERFRGNQSKATRAMNMPLSTFRRKVKKYGIKK